ncbi:hypothetical protein EJB05_16396, partial [Eragrostis curvula]
MNCRSAEAMAGLPPEIRQVELAPDGDGEIVPHSLPPSNVSEHEATTAASIILESMQRSCGDEQQASAPNDAAAVQFIFDHACSKDNLGSRNTPSHAN